MKTSEQRTEPSAQTDVDEWEDRCVVYLELYTGK